MIGSIIAISAGVLLWTVIGPAIMLIGLPSPVVVPIDGVPVDRVPIDDRHSWSFFQAYSWLSDYSIAQMSSTYRAGLMVSLLGLCFLTGGIVGIVVAFTHPSWRGTKQQQ